VPRPSAPTSQLVLLLVQLLRDSPAPGQGLAESRRLRPTSAGWDSGIS